MLGVETQFDHHTTKRSVDDCFGRVEEVQLLVVYSFPCVEGTNYSRLSREEVVLLS